VTEETVTTGAEPPAARDGASHTVLDELLAYQEIHALAHRQRQRWHGDHTLNARPCTRSAGGTEASALFTSALRGRRVRVASAELANI
jgi:hypothetical protein